MNEQTRISLERAAELKSKIDDYIQARKTINRGLEKEEEINNRCRYFIKNYNSN